MAFKFTGPIQTSQSFLAAGAVLAGILALSLTATSAVAAPITYTGPTGSNIDGSTTQSYSFNVTDAGIISDLSVYVQTGGIYGDDVTFSLSHLGTTVTFYTGYGDTYSSVINATFSDAATASAPYNGSATGTFLSANSLSAFNGLAVAGTYSINTIDNIVPDDGTSLDASSITVSSAAATAVPEPASLALLGLSIAGVAVTRRRHRPR